MVTGQIDWAALDQLTGLFLQAHGLTHDPSQPGSHAAGGHCHGDGPGHDTSTGYPGPGGPGPGGATRHTSDGRDGRDGDGRCRACDRPTGPARRPISPALRQRVQDTFLRMSTGLLSGPGGLAAHLRTHLLSHPYTGLSQPLDMGTPTPEIPPHLRRAVILRDKHCQFPGCFQPPSVCQAHHLIPRSKGGKTVLTNLKLLCRFHHLIAIHRWGWTLTCHPDGTTTAHGPDGRVLHSHGPPGQAA